jgi:hypothetical protein
MSWKIERIEGKERAIIDCEYDGKPARFVLRKMNIKEFAYLADECVKLKGRETEIQIGKLIIGALPKILVEAPFALTNNNTIFDAEFESGMLEIVQAALALHGLGGEKSPKKPESSDSIV